MHNLRERVLGKVGAGISRDRGDTHKKPVVCDTIKIQRGMQLNVKT